MLRVANRLWLISDTHFGHRNIVKFQQRPETHEVIMLANWAERVGADDQILHMGDVFMGKQGNARRWARVLSLLPGEKYLILGNHDTYKPELYEEAGFTIVQPFVNNGVAFTHRPITDVWNELPDVCWDWHTNIHGHTHGNDHHPNDGVGYDDKAYVNVCVENTELAPVQLGNIFPHDWASARAA